jgi:PAS domain S-box-containing protein
VSPRAHYRLTRLLRYGSAVFAVLLCFVAWGLIRRLYGGSLPPFITAYPAVMAIALFAGFGPGIVATILTGLIVAFWIMPPTGQFVVTSPVDRLALALFGFMGLFMCTVAELYRRNRRKAGAYDADQALRESRRENEFLANILANASQAFAVSFPDGRIGRVNQAFEQLTGYSAEELRAVNWSTILTPPEWREVEQKKLNELYQSGQSIRYEKEYIRKNGTRVPVELFVQLVRNQEGRPEYSYAFVTDTTERKDIERAFRESEERFRLALRNAPVSVAAQDIDLRYVWAYNQRTARSEEIIGKKDNEIFTAEEAAHLESVKRRVLEQDVEVSEQMWLERPSGKVFLNVFWEPIHDASGKVIGVGSATVDSTPAKLIEEELRQTTERLEARNAELRASRIAALNLMEDTDRARDQAEQNAAALGASEERLRLAYQGARGGAWEFDLLSGGAWWSLEMFELWGIEQGTTMDINNTLPLIHEPDREKVTRAIEEAVSSGTDYRCEFRIHHLTKGERWMGSFGRLRYDDRGKAVGLLGLSFDITDRKIAEQALKAAHDELTMQVDERTKELREKEVLLKEVHHRVKNNLQVISSLVSLQADGSEDQTVHDVLQEVTHRVRSMALVHEKLYQSVNLASIDFSEYVRSLLGYLWHSHGTTGASVRLNLDLEPVSLPVDVAVPCGLMLNELAGNTLKHAFRGRREGEATVSLRGGQNGRVSLEVKDNGVGLPDGLDWRETKSLGLRLVHMLAGQIEADVQVNVNEGTVFHISFVHQEMRGEEL